MIILRSINPATNRYRQYSLEIQPTLFGGHSLVARWGRIGAQRGQTRTYFFDTADQAISKALEIQQIRKRHGYEQWRFWPVQLSLGFEIPPS